MSEKHPNPLTRTGWTMVYTCGAVGIIGSIVIQAALEISGILPGAAFGAAGGGVGGTLGYGLAYVMGHVNPKP